ncbi:hypothetical protein BH18ACT11_BH18ACT11_14090 [soil metagenome]
MGPIIVYHLSWWWNVLPGIGRDGTEEDWCAAADHSMRNIGAEWRNLGEGLLRVETLEAQVRAEWGPRLEKARRERVKARGKRNIRQGRAVLVVALVLALLLLTASFVLRHTPAYAGVLGLAIAAPAVAALYGFRVLLRTPDSPPDPLDLSDRWWGTISGRTSSVRRSGPALSARHYGDVGEEAFVSYLTSSLSEEYVAVRGLLVVRNLDADVIVVGPTGIWVYEVKHWSGEISCEQGKWRRVKTYRQPGGRLVRESEMLKPFDKQWAREAGAVRENLRRRLPGCPELTEAVGGGIVFTHEKVSFREDGSCGAWASKTSDCVETVSTSPAIPGFTMEKHLRAVDALLERSDQLHERQGEAPWATSSSVELAERLHGEAVSHASSYLAAAGESGGIGIGEEIQKARKRAVWHSHPDDPPQG